MVNQTKTTFSVFIIARVVGLSLGVVCLFGKLRHKPTTTMEKETPSSTIFMSKITHYSNAQNMSSRFWFRLFLGLWIISEVV